MSLGDDKPVDVSISASHDRLYTFQPDFSAVKLVSTREHTDLWATFGANRGSCNLGNALTAVRGDHENQIQLVNVGQQQIFGNPQRIIPNKNDHCSDKSPAKSQNKTNSLAVH